MANEACPIDHPDHIRISCIPDVAYEYVVNGKSAIEWIMERYAITTDTKSGIKNDPNDWSREHEKPRYILDLLLSVINVSVKTVAIVRSLPHLSCCTSAQAPVIKYDFSTDVTTTLMAADEGEKL